VRRDPWTGAWQPPGEATVRRVLARIDADALDRAIGAWLAAQQPPPSPSPPAPCPPRRAVAVDGKTLRGSGHHGHGQVHLLAVMDHTSRGVLAQTGVDGKTNEITQFRPLLERLDLTSTVVTADALHTQREHAEWLVTQKHAAYVLIVKANQPSLHYQLATLPWRDIPIADHPRNRGHGRVELRRPQVTTVAGLDFPHAAQALRITRRVRSLHSRRWRTVTVYAVTSLTAAKASPARLADWIRGHWDIEALHHLRDTTFAEDASQVRTGTAPRAMASLRNPWHRHPAHPRPPQRRRRAAPQRPRRHPTPRAGWYHQPMSQPRRHLAEALEVDVGSNPRPWRQPRACTSRRRAQVPQAGHLPNRCVSAGQHDPRDPVGGTGREGDRAAGQWHPNRVLADLHHGQSQHARQPACACGRV
jgi:predicted transposase YbfD/YdcC